MYSNDQLYLCNVLLFVVMRKVNLYFLSREKSNNINIQGPWYVTGVVSVNSRPDEKNKTLQDR